MDKFKLHTPTTKLSIPFQNGIWNVDWEWDWLHTPYLSTVLAMASNLLKVSCAAEGSDRREALAFKES